MVANQGLKKPRFHLVRPTGIDGLTLPLEDILLYFGGRTAWILKTKKSLIPTRA